MSDKTLVIVPCYNEASRFPSQSFASFVKTNPDFHFLFVDDGSSDGTFVRLDALVKENPGQLSVLKLEINQGKAEAVRRGFLKGLERDYGYLAYWDADLATPLSVIPAFVQVFSKFPEIEMVFGARIKLMGADIRRSMVRHYLGRVFATCASWVLGLSIYDTQCGAKMFKRTETLKRIFSEPFRSRWIFDVELIARYLRLGNISPAAAENLIREYPLPAWHDIKGSKIKPFDFFRAVAELAVIYQKYGRS